MRRTSYLERVDCFPIQNIVDKNNKKSGTSAVPVFVEPIICETTLSEDKLFAEEIWTIEKKSTEKESIKSELSLEDTPIYKALKQYRFETCKAEGVQAYCIFNNAQMLAIIAARPSSLEDLKKISGFGDVKCQKYGSKILEIVRSMKDFRQK